MIVILKVGIVGAVLWTVRSLFTRDDIRFPGKRMRCECLDFRQHPIIKIRPRKFLTFNQKYEIPPGLMKAYLGGDDDEEQEE
ncbi:yellow-emperor isoform 2-T2 [Glossina fuscipes fuscipes]